MKSKYLIEFFKNDLWVAVLDVIAVNAAYFLALVARLSVGFNFRQELNYYVIDFFQFAPFYSILCLVVFFLVISMAACGDMQG